MKSGKIVLLSVLTVVFLISACQDEKEKNDYSGVGKIIANRNKARYNEAEKFHEKSTDTKETIGKTQTLNPKSTSEKEALSSIILYEEKVKIVGSESDRTLANGVAYINKKGQIVRIKILRD